MYEVCFSLGVVQHTITRTTDEYQNLHKLVHTFTSFLLIVGITWIKNSKKKKTDKKGLQALVAPVPGQVSHQALRRSEPGRGKAFIVCNPPPQRM
jgi:hypothetical protein